MIGNVIFLIAMFLIGFIIDMNWMINNRHCDGLELCNPYWTYKYYKNVNWFGACMISLAFTAFCPPLAIIYWFYKLCTVGRR